MTLDGVRAQLAQNARARVDSAVRAMQSELDRTAPVDSGELKRTQSVRVTSQTATQITAEAVVEAPYAAYVSEGTSAHVIRPRNSRALVFYWPKKAATVFFAKVNHPGTAANDWFRAAVGKWSRYLAD